MDEEAFNNYTLINELMVEYRVFIVPSDIAEHPLYAWVRMSILYRADNRAHVRDRYVVGDIAERKMRSQRQRDKDGSDG